MKRLVPFLVFIVTYPVGSTPKQLPCQGKEPQGVYCVQNVVQFGSTEYATEAEAMAAKKVLEANKVPNVTITKK